MALWEDGIEMKLYEYDRDVFLELDFFQFIRDRKYFPDMKFIVVDGYETVPEWAEENKPDLVVEFVTEEQARLSRLAERAALKRDYEFVRQLPERHYTGIDFKIDTTTLNFEDLAYVISSLTRTVANSSNASSPVEGRIFLFPSGQEITLKEWEGLYLYTGHSPPSAQLNSTLLNFSPLASVISLVAAYLVPAQALIFSIISFYYAVIFIYVFFLGDIFHSKKADIIQARDNKDNSIPQSGSSPIASRIKVFLIVFGLMLVDVNSFHLGGREERYAEQVVTLQSVDVIKSLSDLLVEFTFPIGEDAEIFSKFETCLSSLYKYAGPDARAILEGLVRDGRISVFVSGYQQEFYERLVTTGIMGERDISKDYAISIKLTTSEGNRYFCVLSKSIFDDAQLAAATVFHELAGHIVMIEQEGELGNIRENEVRAYTKEIVLLKLLKDDIAKTFAFKADSDPALKKELDAALAGINDQITFAQSRIEQYKYSPSSSPIQSVSNLMVFFRAKFKSFCRSSLVILLSLVIVMSNNGCVSLFMPPVDKKTEVMRGVESIHRYLNRGKYYLAYSACKDVYREKDVVPEALESLSNITSEQRIRLAEEYIKWNSELSDEIIYTPKDLFKAVGINETELHEAFKRAVNAKDFSVAFYAARGLLVFGDSSGKPVFIKGLNINYDIDDLCPYNCYLTKESKKEIRSYVAMQSAFALAEMGDSVAVERLKTMLFNTEGDVNVRAYSAYSLSRFEEPEIIEALIQFANDPAKEVRLESIRGLGNFDDKRLPDLFISALVDEDAAVRAAAVLGLAKYMSEDENIANLIIAVLDKERDNNVKIACLNVLGLSKQPDARETVKSFLKSDDFELKGAAIASLGDDLDMESKELIANILFDQREEAKGAASQAALSLSRYVNIYPQLKEPINRVMQYTDLNTRVNIILGLGLANDSVSTGMIRPYLLAEDPLIKEAAIVSLMNRQVTDTSITETFASLSNDPDQGVRLTALQALGVGIPLPSMAESFKNIAANDPVIPVRAAALMNLGRLDRPDTTSFVTQRLTDVEPAIRYAAIAGLSDKIAGQPNLIENINPLLNDTEWEVRQAAVQAISMVDLPQVPELLAPRLRDDIGPVRLSAVAGFADRVTSQPALFENVRPLLDDKEWQVRAAAVEVAGRIDATSIMRNLIPKLKDENVFVRQGAVLTLGANIQHFPDLAGQFKDIASTDVNADIRQYANHALENISSQHTANFEKPRSILLLCPGWDNAYPFDLGRNQNIDWSNSLPGKRKLEQLGVLVRAYNWTGNVQDTWGAQKVFRQYFIDTINEAIKFHVNLKVFMYCWANPVASGIRVENDLELEEVFKKATIVGIKIDIESTGSPYLKSFSELESRYPGVVTYKNYYSFQDPISFPSALFNPFQDNIAVAGVSHGEWFNYSIQRLIRDTFVVDTFNRNIDLGNNVLSRSILEPRLDPFGQQSQGFMSTTGFNQIRNMSSGIGIHGTRFIDPGFSLSGTHIQPSSSFTEHRPIFNTNPDGGRNIRFIPVAPPNYYRSPAVTVPSYTPPMNNTYTPMPQRYNFK
jgi:HEAT repeat protein